MLMGVIAGVMLGTNFSNIREQKEVKALLQGVHGRTKKMGKLKAEGPGVIRGFWIYCSCFAVILRK